MSNPIATAAAAFPLGPKSRRRLLPVALVWFFACLLYTMPATLFVALLRTLAPPLQLQNVSGSFWNGSAAQAFWQNGTQTIALGRVEWQLRPWTLLWLHPSAHIAANYGDQFVDAHISVSPLGSVALAHTSAALPASLLSTWAPIPARGQFELKLDRAELSRTQVGALRGALYWQQARWQWGAQWLALGDFRCQLTTPKSGQIHCDVQGQGALAVNGAADVDLAARNWALQAQVKPDPALPANFRQSLQFMLSAEPNAQGVLAVKRNGHW